jgi:hypothetical protein
MNKEKSNFWITRISAVWQFVITVIAAALGSVIGYFIVDWYTKHNSV